jgi:hypothetical protein
VHGAANRAELITNTVALQCSLGGREGSTVVVENQQCQTQDGQNAHCRTLLRAHAKTNLRPTFFGDAA